MGYISTIKTSVLIFPIIACFITMPYAIWMYRKYGSINFTKALIVYSFILYLECCFFLVNLPLPEIGSVHTRYIDMINLQPFKFVLDFIKDNPLKISEQATYLRAIKHGTFYVPVFNILMLVPFGIYLRYYFKCSLKKTIALTALLSLIFELIQLSGLFFIYNGPYRLCDIDDIIQNTLGGIIGYYIGGIVSLILPKREKLDEEALKKGKEVPGLRRMLAFLIDIFIINIINAILKVMLPFSFVMIFIIYFTIIPIWKGNTIGSKILKFHFEIENNNIIKLLLRSLGILIYFYEFPKLVTYIMNMIAGNITILEIALIYFALMLTLGIYFIITVIIILKNKRFPFDKIFNTVYKSDIQFKNNKIED